MMERLGKRIGIYGQKENPRSHPVDEGRRPHGVVTFTHFTCQPRCALKYHKEENQPVRAVDVGTNSTENGLFLESVTTPCEAKRGAMTRRLQTMPGVGPITAMAIETFAPPMEVFRRGRDFAAWLGLVPVQHSTGGKQVLGKTSKMGQRDIRRL